jgi:signal peptidase II
MNARWGYLAVSAAIVALDQATKVLAHARLRGAPPVEVVPGFLDLVYSRNPGGLFGFLGQMPGAWRVALLTVLPAFVILLIGYLLLRDDDTSRAARGGLALILGGAVGNLIDRVFRGEVIDFIDAYVSSPDAARWLVERFGTAHWPTFNVADSAIVVGACLLALDLLRPGPRKTESAG